MPGPPPAPNPGPTPAGALCWNSDDAAQRLLRRAPAGLACRSFETPASVDIVTQQTMQDQGYRTSAEIAKGAVGVLDLDSSGAPANFSMRGFTFGAGEHSLQRHFDRVASDTTRVMDTANLDQVEFLKGPSALMSGIMRSAARSTTSAGSRPRDRSRTRRISRWIRYGSVRSPLRLRRQHGGRGSRLSLRRNRIEDRQLHRRRLSAIWRISPRN